MSRARPSVPPPLAGPARSRSLRSLLWLGLAAALIAGIGSFGFAVHRIVGLNDVRAEVRTRYLHAIEAHRLRLVALLEQELDGAERGRQDELDASSQLAASLDAADHAALDEPLRHLDDAIRGWRARSATDRNVELAALRSADDDVGAILHQREAAAMDAGQHEITLTVPAGIGMFALGSSAAIAMVVWVLRRTATPLEHLSRIATNGESFPPPENTAGVLEVDTLAWALHELDLAVRDREERLAQAHVEAVELGRFGEHAQQVVDETELHEGLAQRMLAVSDAHALVTLVHATAHARLEVAHATREAPERLHLPILSEPQKCRAARTLKPVTDDGGSPTSCRCALAPAGGSYLCEPMLAAGEFVGVVNLQADWKGHFTTRIQDRVHASIGFGATALANLRLLGATRERALRDPLTGAYNRSFLNEYLNKHLALGERRNERLGVLAVDLDHFKRLNDTHGHAAGDHALIATVQAIMREVRSSDAVVRSGGEELIVVLVDTDLRGATEVAERIRRAIEGIDLIEEDRPVPVRASIGVAAFPEHGRDQSTLLAAADRALYQAKEAGRNRVIAAPREQVVEAN